MVLSEPTKSNVTAPLIVTVVGGGGGGGGGGGAGGATKDDPPPFPHATSDVASAAKATVVSNLRMKWSFRRCVCVLGKIILRGAGMGWGGLKFQSTNRRIIDAGKLYLAKIPAAFLSLELRKSRRLRRAIFQIGG